MATYTINKIQLPNGDICNIKDTTYESKTAANNGVDLSLVTTGEKYIWNNKVDAATTLSGYGITDATITNGIITLGSNTITPLTSSSTLNAAKLSGTIPSECYSDTNVTQVAAITTAGAYPIILANSTATAEVTGTLNKTSTLTYNPNTKSLVTGGTIDGYILAAASAKEVDSTINETSPSLNLPTSAAVVQFIENKNYGSVKQITTGVGLDGGTITTTGTIKAKLKDETPLSEENSDDLITVENVPIASINVPGQINLKNVKIQINPIQNFNGYDSPWPGGFGKNLLPNLTKGIGINSTNGTEITNADYATSDYIPVTLTSENSYYISGLSDQLHTFVAAYNSSKEFLGRTSGRTNTGFQITLENLSNGTPSGTGNIAYLRVTIYKTTTDTATIDTIDTLQIQLEAGSTATTYEPYSNICPIIGYTGATVRRTGKNLIDGDDRYIDSSKITFEGSASAFPTFLCAGQYTLSVEFLNGAHYGAYVKSSDGTTDLTLWTGSSSTTQATFTLSNDGFCRIWLYKNGGVSSDNVGHVQLEPGSVATAYEPHQGDVYTVAFPSAAGTVYGGTLDLVAGTLTVDRALITLDSTIPSDSNGVRNIIERANCVSFEYYPYRAIGTVGGEIISDRFASGIVTSGAFMVESGASAERMLLSLPSNYNTEETIREWFAANPSTFVYHVATPVAYTLDPVTLTMLRGANVVWADCGDISFQYSNQIYPVVIDKDGYLSVKVPWENNSFISRPANNTKGYYLSSNESSNPIWRRPQVYTGTCFTAAAEADKEVICPEYTSPITGDIITVIFSETNTGAVADLTLNVNNTGAKSIKKQANVELSNLSNAGELHKDTMALFGYNGSCWLLLNGDYNTTYDTFSNLSYANGDYKADSVIYRYQLLVQTDVDHMSPLNNVNNSTRTTKTMLMDLEFLPFGNIFYYYSTTTVAAEENIKASSARYTTNTVNLRYSFNCGTTSLESYKDVYLQVSPQTNGKVKLANTMPITDNLPITNDGIWYIHLGRSYSGYQICLFPQHKIYHYVDGAIKEVIPYSDATQNVHGLLSTSDKIKLDNMPIASYFSYNTQTTSYDNHIGCNIIYNTTAPSTRPDGTALQVGDIWLQPV